ncbi:RCC1/BLIP-II [Trematosphaeria pertusa]|uniref:RCC1/BLIP-II n=1 Tax=Trematosphaeria pertusa TaxID=390896 RepID=A0A6A6HUH9_9PLEO|nr:RCC1/BLIP-II [Trematosphaeria pertusa]KAF2241579.1 RCC1/BLIP-II [Trematosphaeria pertusa]
MPTRLYVFGSNGEGQLGIPAAEIVYTPTIAPSWAGGLQAIRGGDNHTLFLTAHGRVYGVGDGRKGQLGSLNTETPRVEKFNYLYHGVSFCAATCESSAAVVNPVGGAESAASTLYTEGASHWGELGLGDITTTVGLSKESVRQELPGRVIDLAAGGWHYVAILSDGSVWGWGKSRLDQLGPKLSTQLKIRRPTGIDEAVPFPPVKVVCGKEFTYLASSPSTGHHYLLGRDKHNLCSSMPSSIKNWKDIGATWHAIFVLFEDGSLIAWGKENMWKLIPEGLPPIDRIAVGSEHVLAVTREGKLISWGWGKHGNCGDLKPLGDRVRNDMVTGFWNDIEIPGTIRFVGAGFCTSFVLSEVEEEVPELETE